MIRLTYLAVLFLGCTADPKTPRIYNVLISSKKNLSPSHAQPVYEPVLRTTSLGYAFPSLFYHTSFVQNVPVTYINPDYSGFSKIDSPHVSQKEDATVDNIQLSSYSPQLPLNKEVSEESEGHEPVPKEQSIPQYDPYAFNYANYLPNNQADVSIESSRIPIVSQQEETDPKRIIANLKKNTGIPDVPPPPLPVKHKK